MTSGEARGISDIRRSTDNASEGGAFDAESLWRACERLPTSEATDPLVGRAFGGVTLTRFIAEGGMGRVYEALQSHPTRRVAVKVLRPGFFTQNRLRRFVREVSTLGSLQHPWITQVYSAGTYELAGSELPYFVMELITDALTITEYVKNRHLSLADRLGLFRKVCDAVAYGHERGIVHRDLKPSNLLIDGLGHPKVIDFGVAHAPDIGNHATTLTEPGQLIGTLQYMSPEQVSSFNGEVDARADVYSLGIILYELLAGCPAHDLSRRPLVEAIKIIHEQRPSPLRSINPAVPRDVVAIVDRCLAKDRECRFQTATELSAAVGRAQSGRPSLITDGRRVASTLAKGSVAVAITTIVILYSVYVMPPKRWFRFVSAARAMPAQHSPAAVAAAEAVLAPNIEFDADPSASLMLQPVEIYRDDKTFRFALRDVNQETADAFLTKNVGMKKWTDQFMFPRVSYWAPIANNSEGTLTYRFDFGGTADSIHLRVVSDCWDFSREAGGVGRGASAVELSRDGENWIALENNIEPRRWGVPIAIASNVPDEFLGAGTLWVRVRCITEGAPVDNGYNVAQFARTRPDRKAVAFEVSANLRQDEADSASQ